mmetsp:Transcript_8345/g.13959  ORF Transcript_8345/g.13959 Transcript_8345/m.13959 type:complete len:178 (-) Transcript_8345:67-600(-)|eukprot:CAMPEP_0168611426 /NCGR_PEP_ID=MMETSP0449_2-20121227/2353_1 /TAXON_ID=1082188 /ORGANISM="Strombidium rassoulzadegani, Strain ras09" /LENGTH=177 /DNA_ID=CAMNT_0008651875 /DNA_START=561 /DNA_END=1094 /DNA_ORIENTATION=+
MSSITGDDNQGINLKFARKRDQKYADKEERYDIEFFERLILSTRNSLKNQVAKQCRRPRTVERVILLVSLLARLCKGVYLFDQKTSTLELAEHPKRMTRAEAAPLIGVPKKTLDDYILFLRHAMLQNYDFAARKNDFYGSMRQFVNLQKDQSAPQVRRGTGVSEDIPKGIDFLHLLT